MNICRTWAFDNNRTPWLREYAVSYLGRFGEPTDLDAIEAHYATLTSELEKATYAAALSCLETGRRNSLYSRMQKDGDLVKRAINRVKSSKLEDMG